MARLHVEPFIKYNYYLLNENHRKWPPLGRVQLQAFGYVDIAITRYFGEL